MRGLILILTACTVLAACGDRAKRVYFNGNYYPTKATKASDDRQDFVVTVRRTDQGLTGAREAGRYEATRYCLTDFGTSEIAWTQGPDAEDGRLQLANGNLVLRGRCIIW
ncbi:hypothetical protein BXY70_2402 [Roseovarius halotolerans]|uniref:Lipoprotein n=1 Tax=Roseovarius halotolerans TaxID=505353 RepID=A0A1X6ZAZ5_9RHOB|nr:hypothetical protein [Roseovarius halotolerans]RKT30413.1 hypothetical protein BXY70_2402 [Roseovarius halotolerans]SLN44110.1 hypothetical protein ROH8110_02299 [Roseovarius halotolerans]